MDNIKLSLIEAKPNVAQQNNWEMRFADSAVLVWEKDGGINVPSIVNLEKTPFPEYGAAQFYTQEHLDQGIVVDFLDRRWRVTFRTEYREEYLPVGGIIEFADAAGENLTRFVSSPDDAVLNEYVVQLFGQPDFLQWGRYLPVLGRDYIRPVFMVYRESDGRTETMNWNLFVETNISNLPIRCLFEASCS